MNKTFEIQDKHVPIMLQYYSIMSEWTAYNALLMKCRTLACKNDDMKRYQFLGSLLHEIENLYQTQMTELKDASEGLLEEVCKELGVNLENLVKKNEQS